MSHIVTRKGPVGDDKEKRQTDSPVKEMKKKIAANAEKEKQAAEKSTDKTEKAAEKPADKKEKAADKHTDKSEKKDKSEKHGEKSSEKKDKSVDKHVDKAADKKDKSDKGAEKSLEKPAEKKDKPSEKAADKKEKTDKKEVPEKSKDEAGTAEKSGKPEKSEEPKARKQQETVKLNGNAQNGSANGAGSSSDDDELIIVEQPEDNDEMFPELAYDDNSDADGFEPDTTATRSLTRRSQVKATRTPETPRPASAAHMPRDEHSKEPKVLRLKEDAALTDRRLRSAGSPKPTGKDSPKKVVDSPSKSETASKSEVASKIEVTSKGEMASNSDVPAKTETVVTINVERAPEEKTEKTDKSEMEVVIEVENSEDGDAARRDTRYSRSRVKVSPYRRSARLADVTHTSFVSVASHTSLVANYTGNNTTMEMDITESSMATEGDSPPASPGPDDSYLAGLRAIRGRRSYKLHGNGNQNPHVQMAYARAQANANSAANASATNVTAGTRPTGTVVGRKRRPDSTLDAAQEDSEEAPKRARLLERLSRPFRTHSTPLPARRAAEIVGINTDLPLTAPVAANDPESLKPTLVLDPAPPAAPAPRDHKRCILM